MEQKLPPEVAFKILKFSRHPVADVVRQLCDKHEGQTVKWKAYCEKRQRSDCVRMDGFALFYFAERQSKKERREGRRANKLINDIYLR